MSRITALILLRAFVRFTFSRAVWSRTVRFVRFFDLVVIMLSGKAPATPAPVFQFRGYLLARSSCVRITWSQ